ncbi:hypothetical protein EUGRSUZ_E03870 [Eucalyptus grandis]|uniref:Uncharacterized protein n=2 Tax=Eucalyptus grandis TaxID=71139 RepID=A0ACC3L0R9_EUCGR|nr:hypothetical protein EUGRSUZ_E03870 [Eucalyptus grandis]
MDVGDRPTSAHAGDLFTHSVAIAVAMETPLHHACMVVTTEGYRYAPMPATTAKLPACSCEESIEVFAEMRFSFP